MQLGLQSTLRMFADTKCVGRHLRLCHPGGCLLVALNLKSPWSTPGRYSTCGRPYYYPDVAEPRFPSDPNCPTCHIFTVGVMHSNSQRLNHPASSQRVPLQCISDSPHHISVKTPREGLPQSVVHGLLWERFIED